MITEVIFSGKTLMVPDEPWKDLLIYFVVIMKAGLYKKSILNMSLWALFLHFGHFTNQSIDKENNQQIRP